MDARQQRRVAANEALFRKMNEQLRSSLSAFRDGLDRDGLEVMCECAVTECADMIALADAEYERVRSNKRWFVVKPDHVLPAAERPVERNDRFWIVEKLGLGGRIAEQNA